ncbi:plasma membrane calcium, partial [Podila epicladia]
MDNREPGDGAQDPSTSSHPPQLPEQQLEQPLHPDLAFPNNVAMAPTQSDSIDPSQQTFDVNSSHNFSSTQTESSGQTQLQPDIAQLASHEASASASGIPMVDRPPNNGPFTFTPTELMNLIDPKAPELLVSYGGIESIIAGLHTDPVRGLSTANRPLSQVVDGSEKVDQGGVSGGASREVTFAEREEFFGRNVLPKRKPKSIFKFMWIALHEKIL